MSSSRPARVRGLAPVLGLLLGTGFVAPAAAATVDVPVAGTVTITQSREASEPRGVGIVHAVRRVPGGTVLYYSLGYPKGSADVYITRLTRQLLPADRFSVKDTAFAKSELWDVSGRKVYTALVDAEDGLSPLSSPTDAVDDRVAGKAFVLYTVMPELPAGTTKVDVAIGFDNVVHDVPVGEGVLTPVLPADQPIEMGTGWPEIDLDRVRASPEPEKSVYPMTVSISDLEQTVVTREEPEQVSVDLSADVLFAVDQATLTGAATAKIRQAAATVNQRAASGRISIVGHTDNTGSDSYNDDLSRRRAAAVAAVLKPLVTVSGSTYAVEGRGEDEPVADNGSEAGRKENRRVSIVITPKAG